MKLIPNPLRIIIIVMVPLIAITHLSCEKEDASVVGSFYTPLESGDWDVSTPEEQGLDSVLVNELYSKAKKIDHLYGLLIVKDGFLVAEHYFNGKNVNTARPIASVTKSYTST